VDSSLLVGLGAEYENERRQKCEPIREESGREESFVLVEGLNVTGLTAELNEVE
jgi:hypothetical protein